MSKFKSHLFLSQMFDFNCYVLNCSLRLQILLSCYNKLVEPSLSSKQSLTGGLVKKLFHQKSIYVRPDKVILTEEKELVSNVKDILNSIMQQLYTLQLMVGMLSIPVFICIYSNLQSCVDEDHTNSSDLPEISDEISGKYFSTSTQYITMYT